MAQTTRHPAALSPSDATPPPSAGAPFDWKVHLSQIFVQITFGGFHVAGKALLGHIPPLALGCLRVMVATPLLLILAFALDREWPTRRDLPRLAILGLLGVTANQILFIYGLKLTTATNAGILMPSIPVFAVAAAAMLGVEKLDRVRVLGIVLAVMGALVMLDPRRFHAGDHMLLGNLLLLANCLAYGVFLVLQRPVLRRLKPLTVVAWSFLFGSIGVLLIGRRDLESVNWSALPASAYWQIGYIVIVPTAINYALNTWSVRRSSPSLVATYTTLQPLTAASLAAIFLHETLSPHSLLGFVLIVAGLVAVTRAVQTETKNKPRAA